MDFSTFDEWLDMPFCMWLGEKLERDYNTPDLFRKGLLPPKHSMRDGHVNGHLDMWLFIPHVIWVLAGNSCRCLRSQDIVLERRWLLAPNIPREVGMSLNEQSDIWLQSFHMSFESLAVKDVSRLCLAGSQGPAFSLIHSTIQVTYNLCGCVCFVAVTWANQHWARASLGPICLVCIEFVKIHGTVEL